MRGRAGASPEWTVSTAPGVCVCPLLQVCVCAHGSRCVHTWMGQMQRTNFTAGYSLLCIIMYVTTKKKKKKFKTDIFFFRNR